jgi:Xaa-Pro aminopeptidase
MILGEPTSEQREAYDWLVFLRETALRYIQPGRKACEVFQSVKSEAEKANVPWVAELGLGHGIGVTPNEPPFLADWDETPLQENMVLVLAPVVETPQNSLLYSKDTILVTPSGCRVLGWYKDWREPYIPIPSI